MKYTLTAVALLILFTTQAQRTVKGKLIDSASKAPLALATVSLFKAKDTSLVTYRLSTPEGEFRIPGIPLNEPCRLVISFSGYDVYRKELTAARDTTIDLGTIRLVPTTKTLEEITVYAERPPVTVRKDTIEFNANSFKTLPSALVEDLLRKLPGVQVDPSGNIMANGKRVNRILVDGKAFFGSDPKMATRNLPANVIDKVQVTDDKEEADRNTDGDLTNVGKVINLTLKKGMKKGIFGKLYGSAGTRDRYEAGGIVNTFRDTLQLSVLAFSNNVNRSGFSMRDVQDLGGFNRSGYNSMMIMRNSSGQEGFAINGISFGGLGAGISTTSGAGFNLNHAPNKKSNFYAQYFFGKTRSLVHTISNTQQFINDTTLDTRTNTDNTRKSIAHTLNLGSNLKPDSLTDIRLQAGLTYNTSDEDIASLILSTHNKLGTVSSSAGSRFNDAHAASYNHFLSMVRRFKAKKGRTLNVSHSFNYNNNIQRFITETRNDYFYPASYILPFNQLRRQDVPGLTTSINASLAEPISKKWTLRSNTGYSFTEDKQDIGIYDKNGATAKYDVEKYRQGSGFSRTRNQFSTALTLSYKIKQTTLIAGLSAAVQHIDNNFKRVQTPVRFRLFNLLPQLNFQRKQLSISYTEYINVPSVNYLIPVPDSTNPFYIAYGNPYLRPAKTHSFYINNFNFFQGSGTNLNMYFSGSVTDNDVVLSRTVEANGVQTNKPVNANGTVRFYSSVGYGKEFKKNRQLTFSFRASPYFNYNRQKLIVNNNTSTVSTLQAGPSLLLRFNWRDLVEFNPQYSPGYSVSRYTEPAFKDLDVVSHYLESELIVRYPKKLVWETNMAYRYNNQVAPGLPKSNLLWNAGVTYLFLKEDRGQLKISVFDILNRNNGFYRSTSQNYIMDQQTNVLKRYGLLTFTYNIRTMGGPRKVGGRDRMFLF